MTAGSGQGLIFSSPSAGHSGLHDPEGPSRNPWCCFGFTEVTVTYVDLRSGSEAYSVTIRCTCIFCNGLHNKVSAHLHPLM